MVRSQRLNGRGSTMTDDQSRVGLRYSLAPCESKGNNRDDFADQGEKVMHSSTNVLTSLFVRGRHLGCACWLSTQKNRVVSLICRTNYCWMLIWRLRSAKERDQILEELDALLDRRILLRLYETATSQKHSFWYVNLLSDQDAMFFKNFEQRMLLVDKDGSQPQTSASARGA